MITRHVQHGSGEPVNTEHCMTLYYLIIYSVYDATLQVYRIYMPFTFFCFALISFSKNPLNKLDKFTRWINLPNQSVDEIRRMETPKWDAKLRRHFIPRNEDAVSLRQNQTQFQPAKWTCQSNPPPSLRIPRRDPARYTPPSPPRRLRITEERGWGPGASQACQSIPNRYFYFHSLYMVNYICFVWHNTFAFYIEQIDK